MAESSELSKTQIDKLGERLRRSDLTESDLELLDGYRRSFTEAYEHVVELIRGRVGLQPSGREAKSTASIIDKLKRESIRFSQMQDIAGCRIVVPALLTQDEVVEWLKRVFERTAIVDRRKQPSHGYRAGHVVVEYSGKPIEVQVRTSLQHRWAQLSEKLSDLVDNSIKYGGGDGDIATILSVMSAKIRTHELAEARHSEIMASDEEGDELYNEGMKLPNLMSERLSIVQMLDAIGEVLPRMKGPKDDLSY